MFSRLKKLYFFLVTYLPIRVSQEAIPPQSVTRPTQSPTTYTGYTALHTVLRHGVALESIQVSGTPALTDSCLQSILSHNPLSHLRILHISSQESRICLPLTLRSVLALHKSCPLLSQLGDLRCWAVGRRTIDEGGIGAAGVLEDRGGVQQSSWTRLRISASSKHIRRSSLLRQTAVH